MRTLHYLFIKPFAEKGVLWGTLDVLVKVVTLTVWVYLMFILGSLITQSILLDYNRLTQLWWFTYCFLMFFGGSLIAYILLFVRDYETEEETEEQA